MPYLEVAGARFLYEEVGTDINGTIIVLHGGRGIGDHRNELAAYLPLADRYRVIAYDQRGCGKSSATAPLTFDRLADDVEDIRKALAGDEPVVLIGGSFGGMIAQTAAIRHPESFSHLILRGTTPSYNNEVMAIKNFEERIHKVPNATLKMVRKLITTKYSQEEELVDDKELMLIWWSILPLFTEEFNPDSAMEHVRTMDFHAATHNTLYQPSQKFDVRPRLHEIKAKTFVFCGEADWICHPDESREIAKGIAGAELMIVEGANHSVHREKNDLVIARIRAFLKT